MPQRKKIFFKDMVLAKEHKNKEQIELRKKNEQTQQLKNEPDIKEKRNGS
jgi:hypothetical protein